jgi:Na+/melibiose symporter-like transporter
VIGVLIGGEGLLALGLPVLVGAWSDRLRTRIGGRLPFVLVAASPLWVYGAGLLVPLLTTSTSLLVAAVPFVAFGGGVIMTLPYALLTRSCRRAATAR